MNIDTVLFDLGGVVCRFLPERRITAFSAATGLAPDLVEERLYGSGLIDAADSGEVSRAELEVKIREQLGFTGTTAELKEIWTLAFEPDRSMIAVAGRLRGAGTVAILTNNDALLAEALPERFPDIEAAFDRLFFSGVLGVRKPGAEAYRSALTLLGGEPGRTLFVDDSERNVAGALAAGLAAVRFPPAGGDPVEGLIAMLRAHGLLTGPPG